MKNILFGIIGLLCLACQQPEKKKEATANSPTSSITSDSLATPNNSPELKDKAQEWLLTHYKFNEGCLENENCSPRYREFLREGIDAVIGNDASDEAYAALIKKWGNLYDTSETLLDRGGFDPPYVQIVECKLTKQVQDTAYYNLNMQSMGYDLEKPVAEQDFYQAQLKVIPNKDSFLIDEIIYAD